MIAETRRKGRIYSEIMRLLNEEIGRYIFSVAVTRAVSGAAALWSAGLSGGGWRIVNRYSLCLAAGCVKRCADTAAGPSYRILLTLDQVWPVPRAERTVAAAFYFSHPALVDNPKTNSKVFIS